MKRNLITRSVIKKSQTKSEQSIARLKLVAIARRVARKNADRLEELKAAHRHLTRRDFLWHYLLLSFATMGRASGRDGLIRTRANYERVTYNALAELSPKTRRTRVEAVCREAKVRMPGRKAVFILGCFEEVKRMGGPAAAKKRLLSLPGREAKIRFLKSLPGIGDKYARNIMMDVYHEDFRDSIAVDARIKKVSAAHGLSFVAYSEEEEFYLNVARKAGLNGWELDRLMFNFQSEFLPVQKAERSRTRRRIAGDKCKGGERMNYDL